MGGASGRDRASRYDREFYSLLNESSLNSARVIVPLVIDLLGLPGSVVDVGCGAGAWLRVFADSGVSDYLGMDGAYVNPNQLQIPPDRFTPTDLAAGVSLDRRFDLVSCLEVAEHLPASSADQLVDNLVTLGDVVLFSAAIPYQGGIHHVNEQWPDYWRTRFEGRGYVGLDPFRMRLWSDGRVDAWFAQNLILYVRRTRLEEHPRLIAEFERTGGIVAPLVHPRTYASKARVATILMKAIPGPVLGLAKRLLSVRP